MELRSLGSSQLINLLAMDCKKCANEVLRRLLKPSTIHPPTHPLAWPLWGSSRVYDVTLSSTTVMSYRVTDLGKEEGGGDIYSTIRRSYAGHTLVYVPITWSSCPCLPPFSSRPPYHQLPSTPRYQQCVGWVRVGELWARGRVQQIQREG